MKPYLPEWKLYLWKKLLLDQPDPEKFFQPSNFVYFDEEERRDEIIKQIDRDTNYTIDRVLHARLGVPGRSIEIDQGNGKAFDDQYWKAGPQEAMCALFELADEKMKCVEITDIEIQKSFVSKYRDERKKHLSMIKRKELAGLSTRTESSSFEYHSKERSKYDNRFGDKLCGLPEQVYQKVESGEKLTIPELAETLTWKLEESLEKTLYASIRFKIRIDRSVLEAKLNDYILDFENSSLVGPRGLQYFDPNLQRTNILAALQAMIPNFGTKNLQVTPDKIAQYGGWTPETEKHYRFFETLFSLEKTGGLITIGDLRKAEVILSFVDHRPKTSEVVAIHDTAREIFNKEYNSFGIKREVAERGRHTEQVTRNIESAEMQKKIETQENAVPQTGSSKTEIGKDHIGYLIFHGQKISIGEASSGKFKLLDMLNNYGFGGAKTIDVVFSAVKSKKDKNKIDGILEDPYMGASRKLTLLENQVREINRAISGYVKRNKLKDFSFRLTIKTDSKTHPKVVWLEERVG